jgi:2-polyprenyl-3-methyl-5-hydroxy-6-metoxy-1,4-benzoquinol methylase
MINWLHAKLHTPQRGWDPIPLEYARSYADLEWQKFDESPLREIEEWLGGFSGKEVLDLGAGPGQFTGAIARKGSRVTWHDISKNYRKIAQERNLDLPIEYSLGYLEDAIALGEGRFDLVFNRICWCYSRSDYAFAKLVWRLLRPGGVGYIDTSNASARSDTLTRSVRLRTWLNTRLSWKVGHPYPPHGRVAKLILQLPVDRVLVDYSRRSNDRVLFVRSVSSRCRQST